MTRSLCTRYRSLLHPAPSVRSSCRPSRGSLFAALCLAAAFLMPLSSAQAQVSGVRSFDGGVAPLFNMPGPGSLYIDSAGTQGYIYSLPSFQTYTFRTPGGQAWSGAQGVLGPQLSIGLIQGANQPGAPVILPGPPRQLAPLVPIQSSLLDLLDDIP